MTSLIADTSEPGRPRPSRSTCRTVCVSIVLATASIALAQPDQQSPRPAFELTAAGNDEILWMAVAEWSDEDQDFANRLYYRDAIAGRTSPAAAIAPQTGRILRYAVVDDCLHVFFRRGGHLRYSKHRSRRELPLPGSMVPRALAGEVGANRPRLWALVDQGTAETVRARWEDRLRREATQPSDEWDADRPPSVSSISVPALEAGRSFALVQYDGSAWQPGPPAPAECEKIAQAWLCSDGQTFHLLWQPEEGGSTLHYARGKDGSWESGAPVPLSKLPAEAMLSLINTQVVFAVLARAEESDPSLECRQWSRPGSRPAGEAWLELPALQAADSGELRLREGSAMAAFGDRLVLMRMGESRAEAGFWLSATGGPPAQPFELLPEWPAGGGSDPRQGLRDFASTLVVAAVLLLVLWRRQESIALAVPLPPGSVVAAPGKRALAFLLDAAPAAAVIGWFWAEPLTNLYHEIMAAGSAGEQTFIWPAGVYMAWLWFRVIYVSWCTVFELLTASTPGKRLFGCQVLTESLARPNGLQIGIRNICRLIELEPHLQIWPFMLVIFFTRNRQRVGDLLARTIVIERQVPVAQEIQNTPPSNDERPEH